MVDATDEPSEKWMLRGVIMEVMVGVIRSGG